MTKIKICGLMRLADVAMVNQARPDAIGFIFAPGRRRQITPDLARQMAAQLNPQIQRVGVFTTNSLMEILALVQAHVIQAVQLHGPLDDSRVTQLRAAHIPVIQAVTPADAIRCQADYPLLDNSHPGSGQALDWTDLPRLKRPFILAGGLTPDNVANAIQQVHPTMVDVSSGVETNGQKDAQKIVAIVARAHQLN